MLTLLLVRHVTTKANESGSWIGRQESEISSKGNEELILLEKKLSVYKWNQIYASPSQRVIETVQQVTKNHASKKAIQLVEALREIEFGCFEGKNFNWVSDYYPEEVEKMIAQKEDYCYPEGESLVIFHKRIADWLEEFIKTHHEGTYLICTHGGTIRSILSQLLVEGYCLHWHFKIDPGSLTVVTITDGYPVIETLNS